MKTNYPVVICGAGPTGLMLAAQLLRFKVDFLIVDTKAGPTTESRAVVVQARSMEIYEQLNLSDAILADCNKVDGLCFWRHGKRISEAKFEHLADNLTPFNYIIIYEQSKNETLLYHHLQQNAHEVEWNTQLVSYSQTADGYTILLKKEEQEIEVTTTYLIACDGARSILRQQAGMEFSGGSYTNVFYVADTHVQAPLCGNSINFFVADDTFNLFFPLVGNKRYRAIGILPKQYYHQENISYEEVSTQVNKDAELDLGFYDTQWYTTYKLHHKKVKHFQSGNLFFCGDAAHVHSPAGGQGMNTGLQDAANLAWKLALVINGQAHTGLLDTYDEERNPVAENLLKTTDRMFNIMAQNNKLNVFLRMYIVPALVPSLMKFSFIKNTFFRLISQTEISYEVSSLSKGKAHHIKAGMRFPYVQLTIDGIRNVSVFHLIRQQMAQPFLLICYAVETVQPSEWYSVLTIEQNEANNKALQKAGFSPSFVCLLRPDGYIGYINEERDVVAIQSFCEALGMGKIKV